MFFFWWSKIRLTKCYLYVQHWCLPCLCENITPFFVLLGTVGVQNVHRPGGGQGHAIWCPAAGQPVDKPRQPPGAGASSGQGHQVCVCRPSADAGVHGLRSRGLPGWATLFLSLFCFTLWFLPSLIITYSIFTSAVFIPCLWFSFVLRIVCMINVLRLSLNHLLFTC